MVQLKELQKENIVIFDNENFIVESIHSSKRRVEVTLNSVSKNSINSEIETKIERIEFILLENQILRLLGFNFNVNAKGAVSYSIPTDSEVLNFFIVETGGRFDFFYRRVLKIQFVHELQNLYFFRTKTKLNIAINDLIKLYY